MAERSSSLTRGGHRRDSITLSHSFTTTTPPLIGSTTHIVAAMHPSLNQAAQDRDGWFVSDFFAFNILFHGLGASQTWLSTTTPQALVDKHGDYMHGNPFGERKVVLSHGLIQEDKITPTTTVKPDEMIDRFLSEVKRATEVAKRERGQVLLLLFCHGLDYEHLKLNPYGNKKLSITMLRGVLEPYVPVCLLTTACYSGGWSVTTDINISTMTAADAVDLSTSWQQSSSVRKRYPGSLFVSSVIKSLIENTSMIFDSQADIGDDNDKAQTTENQSVQTNPETPEQVATYNAFCRSIWESCRGFHRLWHKHSFTFSAQGDEWEEAWNAMASITFADYQARWDSLPTYPYQGSPETKAALDPSPQNPNFQTKDNEEVRTGGAEDDIYIGPLIEMLYQNRLREMISLWQETCPGDEVQGYGPLLTGFMRSCAETGQPRLEEEDLDEEDPLSQYSAVAIIQYRLNMAMLAENILEIVGLPRPNDKSCLMWEKYNWDTYIAKKLSISMEDVKQQETPVHFFFWRAKLLEIIGPAAEQGPEFFRFQQYLVAAVVEGQLEIIERARTLDKIVGCVREAADFYKNTAINDPEVKKRGADWLKAIGH